jgi:hypothetical protein
MAKEDGKLNMDGLRTYIEGKMHRYKLLFAVNGGAFAIVQLISGKGTSDFSLLQVGSLTTPLMALGAIVFTVLIAVDIWFWGQMMRKEVFHGQHVFGYAGKTILALLAILPIAAWTMAARLSWICAAVAVAAGVVWLVVDHLVQVRKSKTEAAVASA